ncbi:MAG: ABC transporter permease [Vulcanimicrobiota bacterium]
MAVREHLRNFFWAFWLGWQVEANWAHPALFTLYSIVKPLASCLIITLMYLVATGGRSSHELFASIYVGNAFFALVTGSLLGLSMVLHTEREHYQTLKYIFLATSNLHIYLCGRASARMITSAVSVIVMLIFGSLVLHIPIHFFGINYPLLIIALFLGLICTVAFGLILSGISMKTAMHNFFFSESASSILFFLSGVIFPLSILPVFLQKIALCLPFCYWMEMIRRAVLPGQATDTVLSSCSTSSLVSIFSVMALLLFIFSFYFFKALENEMRRAGTIDMTTAY